MDASYYFYDLETSGRDPRWHRVLQFAGVACDAELNVHDDPLVLRGRLPEEVLPELEAMRVTQLTPARVAEGLGEGALMRAIFAATRDPRVCLAGYNSIRFDDEFLRFGFYRNLLPPYARERAGGQRLDVLDLARAVRALRPDGVVWPVGEDGLPSAKLTDLTAANRIDHFAAHDAASDVLATVALARLMRNAQPRLFDFAASLRDRRHCERLLAPGDEPLVHVSGMIPRERHCLALVSVLGRHPRNARGYVVFDLVQDPAALNDVPLEVLQQRLFAPAEELQGERLRVKEVRSNRTPFVAPFATLRAQDATRLGIDRDEALARHRYLRARPDLARRLVAAYSREAPAPAAGVELRVRDADAALYDGFFDDADERIAAAHRARIDDGAAGPAGAPPADPRLRELVARYRARNRPDTLSPAEQAQWQLHVRTRLAGAGDDDGRGAVTIPAFARDLERVIAETPDDPLVREWATYARALAVRFDIDWPAASPAP